MRERIKAWINVLVIVSVIALITLTLFLEGQYLLFSMILILVSIIPFLLKFERRKVSAEEIVLIAVLAAIAAISRVPFAPFPSVQPTSFVIMMSALVFGKETGLMVGAISAFVSNLFLGQGPWTPWQMFCWGMIGFSAGLFSKQSWMQSKIGLLLFGGVWGFLFGWIMNLWHILFMFDVLNWQLFAAVYAASFSHDLAHALSNIFFLAVFAASWKKVLLRVQKKYGLINLKTFSN